MEGVRDVTGYMAVRYDGRGSFSDVSFHDTVDDALDSALADGCPFAAVGEHPRARRTRFFAHDGDGWRELQDAEELDRLLTGPAPPTLFWGRAA